MLQCAAVLWAYPNLKIVMFRRHKNSENKEQKKETRYSFIHFLKWNHDLNVPYYPMDPNGTKTKKPKMNSKKEIEDIVSLCLDSRKNEIPQPVKHLHTKRGCYLYYLHEYKTNIVKNR